MNNLPEKIYATPNFDRRWQTKAIDDESVEYTRTDAFIEKAWEWIENNMLSSNQQDKSRLYFELFEKYMKGE